MKVLFGDTIIDCTAIAFDKDGTLIDRYSFWRSLYKTRVQVMKDELDKKTIAFWCSINGIQGEGNEIDPDGPFAVGGFKEEEIVLATAIYTVERTEWGKAVEQARELMVLADQRMPVNDYLKPLPGVPAKLHEIVDYGLQICIVTRDVRARAMEMLELFEIHDGGCIVVTPEDVANGKPAPDMLTKAADLMGVNPEGIVVVGDSPLDMQMAKAAGAYSVAVTSNSSLDTIEGADIIIDSVQDISFPVN
jgi:phosphoglycolate phosphatase